MVEDWNSTDDWSGFPELEAGVCVCGICVHVQLVIISGRAQDDNLWPAHASSYLFLNSETVD